MTIFPILRTSLTILGDVAKLTPIPRLHEAARTLLAVWEAIDVVKVADAEHDKVAQECQYWNTGIMGLAQVVHGPVTKLNECIEMGFCQGCVLAMKEAAVHASKAQEHNNEVELEPGKLFGAFARMSYTRPKYYSKSYI
ncbi:hypothetical protein P692DRAFT_20821836 [Suillus brevipes Sb2]|nr:hypothetical protein P692DRAFT_20821836 [Suillus brevipes Sb2]